MGRPASQRRRASGDEAEASGLDGWPLACSSAARCATRACSPNSPKLRSRIAGGIENKNRAFRRMCPQFAMAALDGRNRRRAGSRIGASGRSEKGRCVMQRYLNS